MGTCLELIPLCNTLKYEVALFDMSHRHSTECTDTKVCKHIQEDTFSSHSILITYDDVIPKVLSLSLNYAKSITAMYHS